MRNTSKSLTQLSLALTLLFACAAISRAEVRDPRLISARAGAVNFVVGDVTVRRAASESWQSLRQTDELRSGDTVRTGADGRAEILLNPGSYLRLGENAELELTDTSLDTLRLRLARGSAIIEALVPETGSVAKAAPRKQGPVVATASVRRPEGFVIEINTAQTQVLIVRSGVYRINAGSTTELYVRSGRALAGRTGVVVKEGTVATSDASEVTKFDKKQKDSLDEWSKSRAEEVARVNNRLQVRALNTTLASMSWDNFNWGGNPMGFWFRDWRSESYTFIPFFSCRSPYGYGYGVAAPGLLNYCDCYRSSVIYVGGRPVVVRNGNGTTNVGGGLGRGTGAGSGGPTGGGSTGGGSIVTGGGGSATGGGSTFGGSSGAITRTPADSAPAPPTPRGGSGSTHRIEPPL